MSDVNKKLTPKLHILFRNIVIDNVSSARLQDICQAIEAMQINKLDMTCGGGAQPEEDAGYSGKIVDNRLVLTSREFPGGAGRANLGGTGGRTFSTFSRIDNLGHQQPIPQLPS